MKIELVPMAGVLLGIMWYDSQWEEEEESYTEMVLCLGIIGIRIIWFD